MQGRTRPKMDFVITVCDSAAGEACPVWPGQPMTAHWGIEDPAAVDGSDVEKERAFTTAFKYMRNRISLFVNLPHGTLSDMALRKEMHSIGQTEGATSHAAALMSSAALSRRLVAEALGTGLLVATVVGSGIMAQTLSRDGGLQLLANTLPTGAILVVLITVFGPVSGAHFNPAVSVVMAMRGDLQKSLLPSYVAAQIAGAVCGAVLAHAMFALPLVSSFAQPRTGLAQWLAEGVATFGLVLVIFGALRARSESVPWIIGLYIVAAYWFTASTSFANPAVTIGRAFTGTFSGIRLADVPAFALAQLLGAVGALTLVRWLFADRDFANPA